MEDKFCVCPICGESPHDWVDDFICGRIVPDPDWIVECEKCAIRVSTPSEALSARMWNGGAARAASGQSLLHWTGEEVEDEVERTVSEGDL